MNRRVVKTEEHIHYQRSLSAFSRLVGLSQAARPLAGGSPLAVLGRDQIVQNQHFNLALRQTSRMNKQSEFRETLALQSCQPEVRPNPSIERTSTGLARSTSLVYVPLRGPTPAAARSCQTLARTNRTPPQ
jgi:hypothetical protein